MKKNVIISSIKVLLTVGLIYGVILGCKTTKIVNSTQRIREDSLRKLGKIVPVFPGGEEALLNFIKNNTIYPQEARKKRIQGKVIVRFVVASDGKVINPTISKSVDALLDAEAIRVVKLLPNFNPGTLNGKPVSVWYTIPFEFKF